MTISPVYVEVLDDAFAEVNDVGSEDIVEVLVQQSNQVIELETQEYIEVSLQGPTGNPGPAGATYVHTQSSSAATWTINHGLNTILSVILLLDSAPTEPVWPDVTYPTLNQVVIQLDVPATGKAYLR